LEKVLIVDIKQTGKDLADILELICEVQLIEDAEEALKIYQKQLEENNPFAYIFCNLTMPKMNGLMFLEKIEEINKEANVFICSLFGGKNIEEEILKYGGLALIKKPYDKENVLNVFNNFNKKAT
jgi:DNA-binding NtrC family response regulator